MDSLKDLLASKSLDEPTEITALKNFCQDQYSFEAKLSISDDKIFLSAPNGILATELRMRMPEINNRCQLTKKLIIKIG